MPKLELETSVDNDNRKLRTRFLTIGVLFIALIAIGFSLGGYALLQSNELAAQGERVHQQVVLAQKSRIYDPVDSETGETKKLEPEMLGILIKARFPNSASVLVTDVEGKTVWPIDKRGATGFSLKRIETINKRETGFLTEGPSLLRGSGWLALLTNDFEPVTVSSRVNRSGASPLYIQTQVDNQAGFSTQRTVAIRLFFLLLIATSLLFVLLYRNFKRSINTIEVQEGRLNEQITRLSNLLSVNKSMQKSIRTASARAVELNEQFLRRVGADLHDGPAQMIGYSVLRLKQEINKAGSNLIGPELHAIKEALDESLEEIRGISSGLVLPELEGMTLEQCLRKVVILHGANSDTEVAQFYQDIPDEISLPIKICAYRFVQEGLNNSHRHGQARKCRLSAYVRDNILYISLKDNGIGFRKSQLSKEGGHLGLIGLQDRIESLGGKLSINSELGVGTALKLSISVADDD